MTDIILSTQNGEPVASSRQIAENFGKEHKDVLRAIENIKAQNCALTSMFFEATYTAGTGKAYPMYGAWFTARSTRTFRCGSGSAAETTFPASALTRRWSTSSAGSPAQTP